VYRKGVDLLVGIIPKICHRFSFVDFIIGGDGAKKLALEEMMERERLQDRVQLLGAIPHTRVSAVLNQGHIFLNCSLTESFCIAILEAASCGLYVVSTNVGGVPEVLPEDRMIHLSEPSVSAMVATLSDAITTKITRKVNGPSKGDETGDIATTFDPFEFHQRVQKMYSWTRVACRTVAVYRDVVRQPRLTLWQRLERYKSVGRFGGYLACVLALILYSVVKIVEWWQPRNIIDVVPDLLKVSTDGGVNGRADVCDAHLKLNETRNEWVRKAERLLELEARN